MSGAAVLLSEREAGGLVNRDWTLLPFWDGQLRSRGAMGGSA